MLSQIDRNLFLNPCSMRAARLRRKRVLITTLAGTVFSLGAWTALQAASESSGQLAPAKQALHGGSNRLLSGIGTPGISADALPYAVLTSAPKAVPTQAPASEAMSAGTAVQAAASETPPLAQTGSAEAARAVIDQWAKAWQSKDVDGYLASYGEGFQPPNGKSRNDWEKLRRQRIAGKHVIQLELREFEVKTEAADRVRINFVQDYRADQFVENGTAKSMLLAQENGSWRILAEESGR